MEYKIKFVGVKQRRRNWEMDKLCNEEHGHFYSLSDIRMKTLGRNGWAYLEKKVINAYNFGGKPVG
jgi:hypothetical protein